MPPCGLSGGAPPADSVVIGPVQPCGWSWPLLSGNNATGAPGRISWLFGFFFGFGMSDPGRNTEPECNEGKAHKKSSVSPLLSNTLARRSLPSLRFTYSSASSSRYCLPQQKVKMMGKAMALDRHEKASSFVHHCARSGSGS